MNSSETKKTLRFLPKGLIISVESSGNMSNFYEHCEAVVNFEKVLKNKKIEGQYRKKKLT